eukprot:7391973-Prymnesium_polylepis.2
MGERKSRHNVIRIRSCCEARARRRHAERPQSGAQQHEESPDRHTQHRRDPDGQPCLPERAGRIVPLRRVLTKAEGSNPPEACGTRAWQLRLGSTARGSWVSECVDASYIDVYVPVGGWRSVECRYAAMTQPSSLSRSYDLLLSGEMLSRIHRGVPAQSQFGSAAAQVEVAGAAHAHRRRCSLSHSRTQHIANPNLRRRRSRPQGTSTSHCISSRPAACAPSNPATPRLLSNRASTQKVSPQHLAERASSEPWCAPQRATRRPGMASSTPRRSAPPAMSWYLSAHRAQHQPRRADGQGSCEP